MKSNWYGEVSHCKKGTKDRDYNELNLPGL